MATPEEIAKAEDTMVVIDGVRYQKADADKLKKEGEPAALADADPTADKKARTASNKARVAPEATK